MIGIARVSMTRERICFAWLSSCCFLSSNRGRVVPLYTQVDTRRFTESRGRIINVSGSVSIPSNLQYKLHERIGLHLQALTCLWALGLRKAPPSSGLYGLLIFLELIRLILANLHPVVISPTLGPRLIWTCSCQSSTLRKIPPLHLHFDLVNCCDVILQDHGKSPWHHFVI